MKIHGSNQTNLHIYKEQMQKQESMKHSQKKDQLEISDEAKKLMEDAKPDTDRSKYIEGIKQAIDKENYHVNYEKTAEKMIDFWSRNS